MSAGAGERLHGPVAVTGATGFIGGALTRALADARLDVRALVRREATLPPGVAPVRGGLDDDAALAELVRDTRLVYHCAGAVRGVDRRAFDAVNVAGTRALLAAMIAHAPDAHLIHLSTLAARAPDLSDYAASKRTGEEQVAEAGLARWTVLRPTAVYGPGDRELAPLIAAMGRGLAPVPRVPDARVTLIHVDDLVAALLAAARASARVDGGRYELCDARAEGYRWQELADAAASTAGRHGCRLVSVPLALLRWVGRINRGMARATGRAPMLTPGKVRELGHPDWRCDPSPFVSASGWKPRVGLVEGLRTVLDTS